MRASLQSIGTHFITCTKGHYEFILPRDRVFFWAEGTEYCKDCNGYFQQSQHCFYLTRILDARETLPIISQAHQAGIPTSSRDLNGEALTKRFKLCDAALYTRIQV